MRRCLPPLVLVALLLPAAPATAARRGDPLRDAAPASTRFADRVLHRAPGASAAQTARSYPLPDGGWIPVTVSPSYADPDALATSYVAFLASLPHGPELRRLRVTIATPGEVQAVCGGEDVLACYTTAGHAMLVPGEETAGAGVTTAYVVAHEYGHHVAAFRSNEPFDALDYGPKYWASRKLVCRGVSDGRLVPGDEGDRYADNPGEAWAETYAQLKYPGVEWTFTPELFPTAGALEAARRDVLAPWTTPVTRRWSGALSARARKRSYAFALRLDGAVRLRLDGPAAAEYDLRVAADGRRIATTRAAGADDRIAFPSACRDRRRETVRLTVLRRSGSGPFRLAARYAG